MLLALIIFVASIALVIIRPRPFNEATAAGLGAVVIVIAGIVSPVQVWSVFLDNLNVLLFFLGLMVVSIVAEKAGFFEWCAQKTVKIAGGKGPVLLAAVFGLGTVITAFFSNDATALILTPIVFTLVTRLKLNPLPYVFACAFIANAASMLLPVSNPVNLLAVEEFNLKLGDYLKHLLIPSLIVISLTIGLFMLVFRKSIFTVSGEKLDQTPVKIDRFFICTSGFLALTALGYIIVSIYGQPLFYPAVGGAVLLVTGAFTFRRINIGQVYRGISWSIFLFIFALGVLVKGLQNSGVIQLLTDKLVELTAYGPLQALFSVTLGTALGSNLINNWPMMMVSVASLENLANQGAGLNPVLIYGAIMGADLGPNIAVLGSLSSMLWLSLLRKRGLDIHPLQFLKLGLIVTPVALIIGVLALYLCSIWWG
ncbi:MAG TPA: SLC13 family permease [Dehalococcoidales bacterium]|nr:SLC13 family permease [Dehalococcoidales bacterium]